jgi:hypothetical protein
MPRIATRLAGPAQVATGPATIYTVPSVTKTIIRHIHVQNPSAAAVTITLSIGADAAGTRLFDAYSIGPNQILDHFCMYVMAAGEILQAASGTNNILVITIDGDEAVLG